MLLDKGIAISMDGRGRALDNVFIERLWWSVKYEELYPKSYADGHELHRGLDAWFNYYNYKRRHSAGQENPCRGIPSRSGVEMRPYDAVAALRPRPCGPPLRGRAPLRDGITDTRPTGLDDMAYRATGSTLKSPIRGRRSGVGAVVEAWRTQYNEERPHSSLNYMTPAAFAASFRDSGRPTASLRYGNGAPASESAQTTPSTLTAVGT